MYLQNLLHRGGVGFGLLYIFCYNIGIPTIKLVYKEKDNEPRTKERRTTRNTPKRGRDNCSIFYSPFRCCPSSMEVRICDLDIS